MLRLTRELADGRFSVILQPRGGLDYFSPDLDKARAQLAAVTALMDDIEPEDPSSPGMIHVVSYSEASHLADPAVIDESIRITRHALAGYRALRARGDVDDMRRNPEVIQRTAELVSEVRELIRAIEIHVHDAVSVYGLYRAFADGFLPVPHLWLGREEFARAVDWRTELVRGSVRLVDGAGKPMSVAARVRRITGREGPQ
jgi:hypothetical protein